MAGSPPDIDALDIASLKALVLALLEDRAALRAETVALREEVRRLKGLSGPPNIKPSGMDKASGSRGRGPRTGEKAGRRGKKGRVRIDERRVVTAEVPAGSRFKGYEEYLVQDLICRPHTIVLRRERWRTPEGEYVVAPLPAGTRGHFGPALRRFVPALYHGGQTSTERVTGLLRALGVDISKRQVMRLLTEGHDDFVAEGEAVLRAGLETAPWISVDDARWSPSRTRRFSSPLAAPATGGVTG